MNPLEAQCQKCPAKIACKKPRKILGEKNKTVTCVPEGIADKLTKGTDPKTPTMSDEEAKSEFSKLQKEVIVIYHCPLSERRRLVDPLMKRIHPNRNELYNAGTSSSTRLK